jgi:proline dehydrogenase
MLANASKTFFHLLAKSRTLKTLASRYGMRQPTSFARRFIAGETVDEAIAAARTIETNGMRQTLDYLGESVASLTEADAATNDYVRVIDAVSQAGIEKNLSLKLTQLGIDVDRASAVDNLRRILDRASGFFVRIDMESSRYTDTTLDIFETLWSHDFRQIGVVLQADLRRTAADLERITALGGRIRLVKGAYREKADVAFPSKADVDANFKQLTERLLTAGHYPAIATHDSAMIDHARRFATEHRIPPDRFEFQMLYGIRRDLQQSLVRDGYRVRVYIPFGRQWFPYFMRRLGERPANVMFVLKGIVSER